VVASYFERSATTTAAWRAVRAKLPAILARLTGVQAGEVIEATSSLCDTTARAEVVATFEPHLADIFDGRRLLDRSLAAIDRCIGLRTRAGKIAATLK
jgi:kynureninase